MTSPLEVLGAVVGFLGLALATYSTVKANGSAKATDVKDNENRLTKIEEGNAQRKEEMIRLQDVNSRLATLEAMRKELDKTQENLDAVRLKAERLEAKVDVFRDIAKDAAMSLRTGT